MIRETQRIPARLVRHVFIGALLLFVLSIFYAEQSFAQSPVAVPTDARNGEVDSPANSKLATSNLPAQSDGSDQESTAVAARLLAKPPLPFTQPQVGPLIKRAFRDDIDRRTTAFLPQSLSNLTAVTMPDEARWIRVDLSEQILVAYEGKKPLRAFVISSGLPGTPTVTGEFRIITKVSEQTMSGGVGAYSYYLPGVKWVQYFYQDYGFHGTYWHNNFGNPMSHGCINMTNADAKWLFDWAGPTWDGKTVWYKSTEANPGTLVIVTK